MLRVEFTTDGREINDYAVVLLLALDGSTETIRVYDGAHGHNEMHRYTRSEGKQPGEPFHAGTLGEGMRAAIEEIERGYGEMIEGWKKAMSIDNGRSPAAKVMDEAIELAIAGRSPYPERAAFIDADTASAGHEIKRAADEGLPVVLVAEDGSTRVLLPEAATR
jgi:hypothetical protein